MITEVIVWQNGMVMVFDADGEQVSELQGPIEEKWEAVKERVKRELDAPDFRGLTITMNAVWTPRGGR